MASGLALDRSTGSAAVRNLVSAMAAFSPPPPGQMDLDPSVRNDANVRPPLPPGCMSRNSAAGARSLSGGTKNVAHFGIF